MLENLHLFCNELGRLMAKEEYNGNITVFDLTWNLYLTELLCRGRPGGRREGEMDKGT